MWYGFVLLTTVFYHFRNVTQLVKMRVVVFLLFLFPFVAAVLSDDDQSVEICICQHLQPLNIENYQNYFSVAIW